MISNLVYTSKDFCTSNQIRFRSIYLLLGLSAIGLHTRNLCYLVNTLTNKIDIYIREKS